MSCSALCCRQWSHPELAFSPCVCGGWVDESKPWCLLIPKGLVVPSCWTTGVSETPSERPPFAGSLLCNCPSMTTYSESNVCELDSNSLHVENTWSWPLRIFLLWLTSCRVDPNNFISSYSYWSPLPKKKSILSKSMLVSIGTTSVTSDSKSTQAGLSCFLKIDFISSKNWKVQR